MLLGLHSTQASAESQAEGRKALVGGKRELSVDISTTVWMVKSDVTAATGAGFSHSNGSVFCGFPSSGSQKA